MAELTAWQRNLMEECKQKNRHARIFKMDMCYEIKGGKIVCVSKVEKKEEKKDG